MFTSSQVHYGNREIQLNLQQYRPLIPDHLQHIYTLKYSHPDLEGLQVQVEAV